MSVSAVDDHSEIDSFVPGKLSLMSCFMRGMSQTAVGFGWWFCGFEPTQDSSTYDGSVVAGERQREPKAGPKHTPERACHAQTQRLGGSIVRACVGLEVVMNVEEVEEASTGGIRRLLHLLQEPRQEVDVVVGSVVCVADRACPVYKTGSTKNHGNAK